MSQNAEYHVSLMVGEETKDCMEVEAETPEAAALLAQELFKESEPLPDNSFMRVEAVNADHSY